MKYLNTASSFVIFSAYLGWTLAEFGLSAGNSARVALVSFMGWCCILHLCMMREKP